MFASRKMVCASVLAGAVALVSQSAMAAPFVEARIVVDGGPNDGASSLTVAPNTTYNYRIEAKMAPVGTTNSTAGYKIQSLTQGTDPNNGDGIFSIRFNLYQLPSDGVQINLTPVSPNLTGGFSSDLSWGGDQTAGTRNGFGHDLVGVQNVLRTGGRNVPPGFGATSWVVIDQGSFTTGSSISGSGVLQASYFDSTTLGAGTTFASQVPGAMKINWLYNGGISGDATNIDTSALNSDPYFGYTGLTMIAPAVPEPGTLGLAAVGLTFAAARRRRRA